MEKEFDVLGIGCCAVDYVGTLDRLPERDEKKLMDEMRISGGGLNATALVAVSRLGFRAAHLGALGTDPLSGIARSEFEKEGVSTRWISTRAGAGPVFAFVVVEQTTGTRTIYVSTSDVYNLKPEDIPEEAVRSANVLLIDDFQPVGSIRAAEIAREHGIPVVLDAEGPGSPHARRLIELSDYCAVGEAYALKWSGKHSIPKAAQHILDAGPSNVIITRGDRPMHVLTEEKEFEQPAFPAEVVDTTGCGDVFHGSLAAAVSAGWHLPKCVEFAAAVAALKCRALGGRAGIPYYQETIRFLKEHGSDIWSNEKEMHGD
jgi:sulfofructose kinase